MTGPVPRPVQHELTELKGRDLGKMTDEGHERAKRRGEGSEGEVFEDFTEP